ncbi:NAD(P)-binding protein [Lophium mytilinum]|uniref:NAD(P)-binding protein n=1 Tax=Lophium mytilinum TaxID=390894 RepID=A0A6A6QSK6_9PEZI|nr:NAD(P)-binding protein [Lophium mytilinum]
MPTKRVLLTGASGFIGLHILDQLLSFDVSVRAVVGSDIEKEALRKQFPRTPPTGLDFAIVPDEDLSVPRAYDDALSATQEPFDTVIHTVTVDSLDEADSLSHFVNQESDGKKDFLQSVQAVAPKVRRVIFTSVLTTFARWLATPDLNSNTRSPTSSIQSVAAKDPEYLLATCRANDDLINDRIWKYLADEKPGFDVVALSAPSVYGPLVRPLTLLTDLEEGNQRIWSICSNIPIGTVGLWSDSVSYYVDVRDFAYAHVQAALIPKAGNKRFVISAGMMPSHTVSDIMRNRFPELADRIVDRATPSSVSTTGNLSKDLVDSTPAAAVLGLLRYRSVDETVTDLGLQLVELERRIRANEAGKG